MSGSLVSEGNVLPRICREVQTRLGVYLRELLAGLAPRLPDYDAILQKVILAQFSLLQDLPSHLRSPAASTPPTNAPSRPTPSGSGGGASSGHKPQRSRGHGDEPPPRVGLATSLDRFRFTPPGHS